MNANGRGGRPRREAYFVQVAGTDNTPHFINVSHQLGRKPEFTKPLATAALRVTDTAVLFSVLKLYKRTRATLLDRPLALPPGPLARLERKFATLDTPPEPGTIVVDHGEGMSVYTATLNDAGVASLDAVDEDPVLVLPGTPVQLTMFLPGVKNRTLVVGWMGYIGKPGTPETLTRIVAQAVNHSAGLPEFRLLSGIASVKVPAPPGRFTIATPTIAAKDQIHFDVPVRLWTEEPVTPVAAGTVEVRIDLENGDPLTGQLLLHPEPAGTLADAFDPYKSTFLRAVLNTLTNNLGADEVTDIVCEIAVAELSADSILRLKNASKTVPGFDLNPRQYVPIAG